MPKKVPQTDLILDIVSRFPNGASVEEIIIGLAPTPSRRTLQYRLSSLVKNGLLIAEGKTRGKRFKLPERKELSRFEEKSYIPLSPSAESVQHQISRPMQTRQHVGYQRGFLDRYRPNVTHYLSESARKKLLELGKTDGHRPAGTYARQIFNRLLIDLSWNSSRLEGNTYSLLETERLLELGEAAEGKDQRETQMILNHKAAIEFLVDSAQDLEISRYTILNIHALLSDGLLPDRSCGTLRSISVGITASVYFPLDVPQLISECFQQIVDTAKAIVDPFEQSFFLMVHLPYLQAFDDVNKRVSRLSANLPLIRENLCPLSFIDVPEQTYINGLLGVYELNRVELLGDVFIWAYERSCSRYAATRQTLGDPDPLRIRYRDLRKEVVSLIVCECLDKRSAIELIRKKATEFVAETDQMRFIESVETELMSLHKGNIARYRLRPSEYDNWQKTWH